MKDLDFKKPMKGLDFEPINRTDSKGKVVKATVLPSQVIVMPKLNGVRMRWNPTTQALYSSNGNRIGSCDHIVKQIMANEELRKWPLDGESYFHGPDYTFSYINGKTRRKQSSKETEFLQFHIFDIAAYNWESDKLSRLTFLKNAFSDKRKIGNKLFRVPFGLLEPLHIDAAFKGQLKNGYEGIMIFNPDVPYMEGKQAGTAWKWKPKADSEYTFLHFNEAGTDRNKDTFGSIQFLMEDGQTFACSGISDELRKKMWANPPAVGTPFTVEYGDVSDAGIPIFPRLKDCNSRWDQ